MAIDLDGHKDVELSPLEYMISLGAQGNHVLFDAGRIRKAFEHKADELSDLKGDMVLQVREAINQIFAIPGVEAKREFIETLPPEVADVLIHLYFQMIEKTMLVTNRPLH